VSVEAGDRITRGGVQSCHPSKLPIAYMPSLSSQIRVPSGRSRGLLT
jgi:hypothetical protein